MTPLLAVGGGAPHALVQVAGISSLDLPQRCDPRTHTTELGTQLVVRNGSDLPIQVPSMAPWQCVTDRNGVLRQFLLSTQ